MPECRVEGTLQVVRRRHVVDRVVCQYHVERASEIEGAHVTERVLALWIQAPRHVEHRGAEVGEAALERAREVVRDVAAAAAEFEERAGVWPTSADDTQDLGRFACVLLHGRDHGPPLGKLVVEEFHWAGGDDQARDARRRCDVCVVAFVLTVFAGKLSTYRVARFTQVAKSRGEARPGGST